MHYIVGIDFGTHYTKLAYRASDSDKTHLFKFDNDSYKLPSTIKIDDKNKWDIGFDELQNSLSLNEKLYKYFKIAYAQNDEVDLYNNITELTGEEFNQYSADLLSIAYLHKLIVKIKTEINSKHIENRPKRGIFSRLHSSVNTAVNNTFEWRIGVPTEYSSRNQQKRFVKFNLLLLIAKKMSDKVITKLDDFGEFKFDHYASTIKNFMQTNQQLFKKELKDDIHSFFSENINSNTSIACMQKEGLRVLPETAAAINVMVGTNSILPGVYASVDIGGGSTDMTFFRVAKDQTNNQEFNFLGSVSVNFGVNDLVSALAHYKGKSIIDLRNKLNNNYIHQSKEYITVFHAFLDAIEGHLIYLYQKKIMFSNGKDSAVVQGVYALMLGGGALLPTDKKIKRENQFLVFNNGSATSSDGQVNLEIKPLHSLGFKQNTVPSFDSLGNEANTVMIAFGLTTDMKRVNKQWDFSIYDNNQLKIVRKEEVGNFPWEVQIKYVYERLTELKVNNINEQRINRNKEFEPFNIINGRCLRKPLDGEDYPDIQKYFQCLLKHKYFNKKYFSPLSDYLAENITHKPVDPTIKKDNGTKNEHNIRYININKTNNYEKIHYDIKSLNNISCIVKKINLYKKTIEYYINDILTISELKMIENDIKSFVKNYKKNTHVNLTFDKTEEKNIISIHIPGISKVKNERKFKRKKR